MSSQEITLAEFTEIYDLYAASFGHTFTTFALTPSMDAFEIAYTQMLMCLNGSRTEPVTQESIGQTGEGVVDAENNG